MERKIAEQIVALVNGTIDQLIATLDPVEAAVSPEEFAAYKRGIARVITAFDTEVIELVTREYPDLKPADDDSDHAAEAEPDLPRHRATDPDWRAALTSPTYLPFILLLAAVLGLWLHRMVWMTALTAAVIAGVLTGALHWLAAVWIALLAALALGYTQVRDRSSSPHKALWQALIGLAFLVYALALGLALLPGFNRIVLVQPQVLSAGAAPYGISACTRV